MPLKERELRTKALLTYNLETGNPARKIADQVMQ